MARSRRYEVAVGLLLVAALVVLGWMALRVGSFAGFGHRLHAEVDLHDVAGLDQGAFVTVAGVQVGSVERLELKDDHAIVVLGLDPSAGIRQGTKAAIRAKSVLGEKYVALIPGPPNAPPLKDGAHLEASGHRVEIDDLVNALGPMVTALDEDAVKKVVDALAKALEEDPDRLPRMLANADTTLANTAEASKDLPALTHDARTTLADARRALGEVQARAAEARTLLAKADATLDDVQSATEKTPQLVSDADGAVKDARAAMARLDDATASLQKVLDNLSGFDKTEVRRLLREDGVLVRIRSKKIEDTGEPPKPTP